MKDAKRAVDIVMEMLDVVEPAQEDVMEDASGNFRFVLDYFFFSFLFPSLFSLFLISSVNLILLVCLLTSLDYEALKSVFIN